MSSGTSQDRPQRDAAAASAAASQQQATTTAAVAATAAAATTCEEQNNNSSRPSSLLTNGDKTTSKQGLMRKRSSVQSNLSTAHSNGGGGGGGSHSLSSSTTNTSNEDDLDAPPRMSNAEYEHIRNTTLLFFLDRLYLASQEGKEARTLHDLSCLFGTREFTREMRQIVGASRNGLKKFLQSYPSLFQIEGDKVFLTQLKQDTQVAQRDYNKEAVDYFKQKLLQFGTSLVPIKNLFGYRSQASQEVRHVSGKSTRDFKHFLKLNEDVFEILSDEHVVLKSALRELESQGQTSLSLQQSLQAVPSDDAITMDPYLNKQFAHLIEDCMKKMMPTRTGTGDSAAGEEFKVTLGQLHEQIQKQCQNELFLKMVKTLDDLKVFLRMHPKLFKRSRGKDESSSSDAEIEFVSLLSESERRELEAQTYPSLQRQHSTLEYSSLSSTRMSSLHAPKVQEKKEFQEDNTTVARNEPSEQPFSSLPPVQSSHRQQQKQAQRLESTTQAKKNQNAQEQVDKAHHHQVATTSQKAKAQEQPMHANNSINRQGSNLSSQHQLRANAPPFVPARDVSIRQNYHQSSNNYQVGPHNESYANFGRQNSSLGGQSIHQRQALGSRPALMPRSVSNLNSPSRGAYHQEQHAYPHQHNQGRRAHELPPIDHRSAIRNYLLKDNPSAHGNNMSWNHHPRQVSGPQSISGSIQQQPASQEPSGEEMRARTVDMVREASNIITKIMTTTEAVAFDCKGYNLGFDGQITLIQFGYLPTKQVDPMHLASSMSKLRASSDPSGHDQENGPADEQKPKPEVCVFDLITNPELAYCLKPLLESDKIVKIVHDVRNKSNALFVQFKIILNNVFDTQVANLVIQQQDTGKPAYKSRYISMSKLCEIYGSEELMKYRNLIKLKTTRGGNLSSSSQVRNMVSSSSSTKDVNYWRARPLTKHMIFEATMDVYCLVGGIYQNLKAKIKPEYEPLFDQLNLEGVLARIKPDEIRSAKKERKIDLEVIDLKRKLYSETLGPVVLSNREIRLLRHIDLTDEVRQKIQQCKKVAKKLERLDMKAQMLLEAKQMSVGGHSSSIDDEDNDDGDENDDDEDRANRRAGRRSPRQSQRGDGDSPSLCSNDFTSSKLDELSETGMMMDSSTMFDELKSKMIESSSLLESLEDDDTEAEARLSSGHHSHQGSSMHDCCHCQCHSNTHHHGHNGQAQHQSSEQHVEGSEEVPSNEAGKARKSTDTTKSELEQAEQPPKSDLSTKGDIKAEAPSEGHPTKDDATTTNDESMASSDSKSSSACDMAVQCDLLS